MGWLDNQVAVVTGGGSGIGLAVVERFVEEGARVGILERVTNRVERLGADFGEAVVAVEGDVSRLKANKAIVTETLKTFGRLDIFVGNAGVVDGMVSLADIPEEKLNEAFDEQFSVNVKGCFFGAKAALPHLLESEGCMIFTASVAAFNSGGGGTLYTATKHAVLGMIRQLAVELAPRVRVNGVGPGGTLTDLRGLAALGQKGLSRFSDPQVADRMRALNPLQLALEPKDHAGAYLFLATRELSRAITGTVITTDAGSLLRWPRV